MVWNNKELQNSSGYATGGVKGQCPHWQQTICHKEEENQEKGGKIGKKRRNQEGSLTLPPDRADYTTAK